MKKEYIIAGAGAVAALYVASRVLKRRASGNSTGSVAGDIGADIGGAVVDGVSGVGAGVVTSIGEAVGIPATDADKCRAAMAAGEVWDASFYCPAPVFLSWATDGFKPTKGG